MIVFGILVAYESDISRLALILKSLRGQCQFVVADNSESPAKSASIHECVLRHGGIYLPLGGNRGIGAAQNAAIQVAWQQGGDAVLLLDDDSIPLPNLVETLTGCRSLQHGERAIFGANAVDGRGREISNAARSPGPMPRCREMMSSGTLIRRELYEQVGPFDESLFIDCIDFDWGWRAQSLGIPLYLCRATSFTHRLGQGEVAGVRFPSPIRHYYQFRNILRMLTRPYTPLGWRAEQIVKLPIKLVLMVLLMPDTGARLRFAFTGIRDALMQRNGKWLGPAAGRGAKP